MIHIVTKVQTISDLEMGIAELAYGLRQWIDRPATSGREQSVYVVFDIAIIGMLGLIV